MKQSRYLLLLLALLPNLRSLAQQEQAELENAMRKLYMATVMTNLYYVDSVDHNKLTEGAIIGMLSKLDPHSSYTNAKETKRLTEPMQGSFEGIGVQFNMLDDTLVVIQTVSKGPSERVGILAGDRIVSVNDTAIAGVKMPREDIMMRLRGPKGTKVRLGIVRQGVEGVNTFTVTRDKIPITTLDAAYMLTPTIGLIRFSSFGQTTYTEVMEAIRKLKQQGMKDLVLDLQQNGGGLLDAAAEIASEFLPKGDTIVYIEGRRAPAKMFLSTGGQAFQQGRVAVLIDEYSASAAEIVAGALQDNDRGIVVGRRSFGKGLVQRPIDLPDGSMIRLTFARYYTPSGRCIQKPYVEGDKEAYARDALNRFMHGELTNADSIRLPDSLKYTTRKLGRTVYGGGGIMPDHFVPLDTTRYTRLYRNLSARSIILNANLHYLDKNRKRLKRQWPTFEAFRAGYEVPEEVVAGLLAEGEKQKLKPADEADREKTVALLRRTMKALVARDLWDLSEYFALIYEDDPVVQRAIQILSE